MSEFIIKVEDISKQYRLGLVGTGTLSHDITRWWYNVRGLEDPYLKIGEVNDRSSKGKSDYVWALRDINFDVKPGEILGIIGKNGAGKSTLLKLLSRVTAPTTGKIVAHGRIASLLEVGTGFHPELTGRENVFLNGAILGMTKREIKSKFDEIVDFAGCERYIDTPVKRYSSGMYVRLAFAVAAHLEPEILVVDEVLAVGDAEFQKKAIGKMKNVSDKEGRTVLFVSHNMAAVKSLCSSGIVLRNGNIAYTGGVDEIVSNYLKDGMESKSFRKWVPRLSDKNNSIAIDSMIIIGDDPLSINNSFSIEINFEKISSDNRIDFTLQLKNDSGGFLFSTSTVFNEKGFDKIGRYSLRCHIPANYLNSGDFSFNLLAISNRQNVIINEQDAILFNILPSSVDIGVWMGRTVGDLKPNLEWEVQ